ncbi:MAG: toxin HipA [Thermoleophilia bacterium]|nr:toxin HipA [Thermoleophilia bacterium]
MAERELETLRVLLGGRDVGRLAHIGSARMQFTYDDPVGPSLSMSMPARVERYGPDSCSAYFGGLLPEQGVRDLIERQERVSRRNDFALLKLLGGDVAGAVSLFPAGEVPERARQHWHTLDVDWLANDAVIELVQRLPHRPVHHGPSGPLRLSLAGAQDKAAVVVDGDRIGLPRGTSPSTHILKIGDSAFAGLVEVEHFCLHLARSSGLDAASADMRMIGDFPVLLVERFDRIWNDGRVARVHQEDTCQALGISSLTKYESEGGPSISDVVKLARTHVTPPGRAVLELLDRAGFHELVGNADAHGKNWSFLLEPVVTPTPLYDVVCTLAWNDLDERLAMAIGGERRASRIDLECWERQAVTLGLAPRLVRRRLIDQAAALRDRVGAVRERWQPITDAGNTAVDRVVEIVRQRCERRMCKT